jgi:polysaccharide biosynthesis protein PslG
MFSRPSRALIRMRFGLLGLGIIALSACAAGAGTSAAKQASDPIAGSANPIAPATAAAPATATVSGVAAKSAAARRSAAARKSAAPSESSTAASAAAAPAATTTAAAPSAASGGTVYGVSDPDLITESAAVQVQQLEAMKAMGVSSVRLEANWNGGQPNGAGSFDWAPLDLAVASIQQAGLSADLVIDGCPSWAAVSGAQGDMYAQPASSAAFATWAGAVAARYGPKGVKYFEIWNEPNLAIFWQPKPDPAAYTADLKAAYTAIKAADPSAFVLSGGFGIAADDGTNYDPRTFLQDMYADGAQGSFDGLGYHPYSYPDSPDTYASWSGWSIMNQTSPSLRSIMTANGDSAKKIFITEYGAPTSGPNSVGEGGQSTDLVQAITQASKSSWIGALYIYTWADLSSLPADQDGFGLLTDSNAQKSAYSAVASALGA